MDSCKNTEAPTTVPARTGRALGDARPPLLAIKSPRILSATSPCSGKIHIFGTSVWVQEQLVFRGSGRKIDSGDMLPRSNGCTFTAPNIGHTKSEVKTKLKITPSLISSFFLFSFGRYPGIERLTSCGDPYAFWHGLALHPHPEVLSF